MMSFLQGLVAVALLSGSLTGGAALAQSNQRVSLTNGNGNTSVGATVTGRQYRDHVVRARAGQTLGVSMIRKGVTAVYFNILQPDSSGEAIYNSAISGDAAAAIKLPKSGEYRVRVYLLGSAKEGKRPVQYQLSISVM